MPRTLVKNRNPIKISGSAENIIIRDDEGRLLYGHQFLRRVSATQKGTGAYIMHGLAAEAYIVYIADVYGYVKEVQELVRSGMIDSALLEKVSDAIDLSMDDIEALKELVRRGDEEGSK